MNNELVETLLPWSEPREVQTKQGPRTVRNAEPDEPFWTVWRQNKEQLRTLGLSVGEYKGKWQVAWWRKLDHETVAQRQANEAASRAAEAEIDVPAPDGCTYMPFQKAGIAFVLRCFKE